MDENRFKTFFEQFPLAIAHLNLQGCFIEINPTLCRLVGHRAEALRGLPFHQIIHPEDRGESMRRMAPILSGEATAVAFSHRILHPDNTMAWVMADIAVVQDAESRPDYLACTLRDISRRKQLEANLRDQVNRERLLAEITRRIRQSLDWNEILAAAALEVRRQLETDRVIVYRFDADPNLGGTIITESVSEDYSTILGQRVMDPCFTANQCLGPYQYGKIQNTPNIHAAGFKACYVELLTEFEVVAQLVLPIILDTELWGLLSIQHCRAPRQWRREEVELVGQIADQIAIALKQGRIYQQVQQEVQRQQAVNALSHAVLGAQSLDAVFTLALSQIMPLLGADYVNVAQCRQDKALWLVIAEDGCNATLPSALGLEIPGGQDLLSPAMQQGEVLHNWMDARWIGAAVGAAVYFWRHNVLLTIVAGMLAYLPLHVLLGW